MSQLSTDLLVTSSHQFPQQPFTVCSVLCVKQSVDHLSRNDWCFFHRAMDLFPYSSICYLLDSISVTQTWFFDMVLFCTYRKNSNIIRTIFTNNRGPIAGVCTIHVNWKKKQFSIKPVTLHKYIRPYVYDYSHQNVITLQNLL